MALKRYLVTEASPLSLSGRLESGSMDRAGTGVAVVARSNLKLADVQRFRTAMCLPLNTPAEIVDRTTPGVLAGGEPLAWNEAAPRMAAQPA